MMFQNKRILILAPHTDDAELGCGGTMARMIEEGAQVRVVAFSRAEDSVPAGAAKNVIELEMRASLGALGLSDDDIAVLEFPVRNFPEHRQAILDAMIRERRGFAPDRVFIPNSSDIHQDHQIIHQEAVRAFNNCSLWGYELPWNNLSVQFHAFVALTVQQLEQKKHALSHYHSQIELKRPYFMGEFVDALAHIRGLQGRLDRAEAFEIIREIV
jgi:N-acetylglucosamine malate deacetylase 1